jgi:hypothetical protein
MFGVEPPAQARPELVNAEGILKVLATQMDGTANCWRHGVVGAQGTPAIWLRQQTAEEGNDGSEDSNRRDFCEMLR